MAQRFQPEEMVQQMADAFSEAAVECARHDFKVELDWTDRSIEAVEDILESLHLSLAAKKSTSHDVATYSKMFGSYVGEVFRRNHGATWGVVTLNGTSVPGLKQQSTGDLFWPWGRVENRLTNGPEENVWNYYESLLEPPQSNPSSHPRGWWSRIFGQ